MTRLRRLAPTLSALVLAAAAMGCNPLIYDKLLEDVYVSSFSLRGPTGVSAHSSIALTFPADESGRGHVLMASADDASMAWLALSAGAESVEDYPTVEDLQALIFPLDSIQAVEIGGLAQVPPPQAGLTAPHVVAVFKAPGDPMNARVVRFDVPNFIRTDMAEIDITNPKIDGSPVPKFGSGLAAINLDGAQTEPEYEVAVGSEAGVLVFDSVGANLETYMAAKAGLGAACVGAGEPNCYHFTLCDAIGEPTRLSQGLFLDGDAPAIVASNASGLAFIADKATPEQNMVGAPIYDCAAMTWAAPVGSSPSYGQALFVNDLDGDGHQDLLVGDPGANRVHLHMGSASGLSETPTMTLDSLADPETLEFGYAIGRADLGEIIGPVLVVGAPGSTVGGQVEVGKVYVYDMDDMSTPLTVLADQTPEKNTRYGIWVGGIRIDPDRDELVISGRAEGKIHVAINEDDPYPQ